MLMITYVVDNGETPLGMLGKLREEKTMAFEVKPEENRLQVIQCLNMLIQFTQELKIVPGLGLEMKCDGTKVESRVLAFYPQSLFAIAEHFYDAEKNPNIKPMNRF